MNSTNKKIIIFTIFSSILLIIELLDFTFGRTIDNLIHCKETNEIELPCFLVYHIIIVVILAIFNIVGFIYWLRLKKQKLSYKKLSLILSLDNLSQWLRNSITQRILNAAIATILLIIVIVNYEYAYFSSEIMVTYKLLILTYLIVLFILQTILNKNWLNILFKIIFTSLLGYVIYTYIFAFFDPYDAVMKREYGLIIKTYQFSLKSVILIFALILINKIRPLKKSLLSQDLGE
jgi:hypothetical protein